MEWNTLVGTLSDVPLSGRYYFPRKISYCAQFASPELIYSYCHEHFDGKQDPRWRDFGTEDVEDYCFWCSRSCAIACLKMCIETLARPKQPPSMIELIQQGLAAGGYIIHNEQGELVNFGWIYQPLVNVGQSYGIKGQVYKTLSIENICSLLLTGALVIASVSDEIGERNDTPIIHKGGMLSLCMGLNGQIRSVKRFCFTIHLQDFQSYRKMPCFPTTDLLPPSPGGDLHFGRQMSKTNEVQ